MAIISWAMDRPSPMVSLSLILAVTSNSHQRSASSAKSPKPSLMDSRYVIAPATGRAPNSANALNKKCSRGPRGRRCFADVSRPWPSVPPNLPCPSMSSSTRQSYTGFPWPGVVKPGIGQAFENSYSIISDLSNPLILHLPCRFLCHLAYAVIPTSIGSIVQHEHLSPPTRIAEGTHKVTSQQHPSQPRPAMKVANHRLVPIICRRAHCSGLCYPYPVLDSSRRSTAPESGQVQTKGERQSIKV